MRNRIHFFITMLVLLVSSRLVQASAEDFFRDTQVDKFMLSAPFAKMAEVKEKNRNNFLDLKKHKFNGVLSYVQNNKLIEHQVEISIKGFTTSLFS